ncbi:hypothetical protein RJ641_034430 [Dillenia turbinata]|uniref:Uncharacterized protein n=1 Tax=Dillenia turbinata TaxID=194707 RepID=A0AAN8ZHA1_9MAGN
MPLRGRPFHSNSMPVRMDQTTKAILCGHFEGPTQTLLKHLRSRLSTTEDSGVATPKKEEVVSMAARLPLTSKELSLQGVGLNAVSIRGVGIK